MNAHIPLDPVAELKAMVDHVQVEDWECIEKVYPGPCADLARPGHFCHLEQPIYDLAASLTGRMA